MNEIDVRIPSRECAGSIKRAAARSAELSEAKLKQAADKKAADIRRKRIQKPGLLRGRRLANPIPLRKVHLPTPSRIGVLPEMTSTSPLLPKPSPASTQKFVEREMVASLPKKSRTTAKSSRYRKGKDKGGVAHEGTKSRGDGPRKDEKVAKRRPLPSPQRKVVIWPEIHHIPENPTTMSAAMRIQSVARGFLARHRHTQLHKAASVAQNILRSHFFRVTVQLRCKRRLVAKARAMRCVHNM